MSAELMNLLAERLGAHDKFDKQASEALIVGDKSADFKFALVLRYFVESAYLAVLAEVKPDVALATAKWVMSALTDGDTAMEVAYQWRHQVADGEQPWLPPSIIEAL